MKFTILMICVVFVAGIRSCSGIYDKDDCDDHHHLHHLHAHLEHDNIEEDYEEPKAKTTKHTCESKIEEKHTPLNLHLHDESAKNVQLPKRPVSKLQQEIQILGSKQQELRPKAKPVSLPVLVQPRVKLVSLKQPTRILSEEFNRQLSRSAVDNHSTKHDHDHDNEKDNETKPEKTLLKAPTVSVKSELEDDKSKKVTKLDQEKGQEKNDPPKIIKSEHDDDDSKSERTNKVTNKASCANQIDAIKEKSKNNTAINNSKADSDKFTETEHIVSEVYPTKDVEKLTDSSTTKGVTSESKQADTLKPASNIKSELKPADHGENNKQMNTNYFGHNQQLVPGDCNVPHDVNLNGPINLLIKNEDVQEVEDNPKLTDNTRSASNPYTQNGQYYTYANYNNGDHAFQWPSSSVTSPATNIASNTINYQDYWSNPISDNACSNTNQYFKPDNTYTPPPYKYPYEDQLKSVIEAYRQQGYQNRNNVNQLANPANNGWNQNYPWNYNPYQNSGYQYKTNNPGYKYNEVKIPSKNSDRIWRHWHKTQVVINNQKGKPCQMEARRLSS